MLTERPQPGAEGDQCSKPTTRAALWPQFIHCELERQLTLAQAQDSIACQVSRPGGLPRAERGVAWP